MIRERPKNSAWWDVSKLLNSISIICRETAYRIEGHDDLNLKLLKPWKTVISLCSPPISSPPLSRRTQDDSFTVMKRSPSGSLGSNPYLSNSNPDLTSISSLSVNEPEYYSSSSGTGSGDAPEHVLKIYRADQSCKYFLVHKVRAGLLLVMSGSSTVS